jgi:hypothetical protein
MISAKLYKKNYLQKLFIFFYNNYSILCMSRLPSVLFLTPQTKNPKNRVPNVVCVGILPARYPPQ